MWWYNLVKKKKCNRKGVQLSDLIFLFHRFIKNKQIIQWRMFYNAIYHSLWHLCPLFVQICWAVSTLITSLEVALFSSPFQLLSHLRNHQTFSSVCTRTQTDTHHRLSFSGPVCSASDWMNKLCHPIWWAVLLDLITVVNEGAHESPPVCSAALVTLCCRTLPSLPPSILPANRRHAF